MLRQAAVPVGESFEVAPVDSHVAADAGEFGLQGRGDPVEAVRELVIVLAQLPAEAVERPL